MLTLSQTYMRSQRTSGPYSDTRWRMKLCNGRESAFGQTGRYEIQRKARGPTIRKYSRPIT
ncbi:hypothetical protein KTH_37770 [Thermosporothrix hazakensis]|uniref:Uncharacterized protein n=1 Tax=Thermosporothrix sp. COM3 TaxID=2490863 RepID=A0A455SR09_9CHLR|nr:hypothetical protein KTC_56080 [Thermosporothrix sp. COM3]GCE48908.1 hypothetical protein KTH_37770 [Thermosporothrix hazakensis]